MRVGTSTFALLSLIILPHVGCKNKVDQIDVAQTPDLQFNLDRTFKKKLDFLNERVTQDPQEVVNHQRLAQAYLELGRYSLAEQSVNTGLNRHPMDAGLYDIKGAVIMSQAFATAKYSDTDSALSAFEKSLSIDPIRPKTLYNIGLVYTYQEKHERAKKHFYQALSIDSTLAIVHKKLGIYYRQTGYIDSAVIRLSKAASLNPKDGEVHFNLGIALRATGKLNLAESALKTASELNPHSPQIFFNLSQIYLRLGDREKGMKALRKSEILRQFDRDLGADKAYHEKGVVAIGSATTHHNTALNLALKGKYEIAIIEYQKALAINPQLKDAHSGLGIIYTWKKDLEQAIKHFKLAIKLDTKDPLSHARLGMAFLKKNDLLNAFEHLNYAAKLDTALHEAFFGLGMIAARRDSFPKAIFYFEKASELNPGSIEPLINLGVATYRAGDLNEAKNIYERAIKLDPENTAIHRYLGDVYLQLGNTEKSSAHMKSSSKSPTN